MFGVITGVWERNRQPFGAALVTAVTLVTLLWFVHTRPIPVRDRAATGLALYSAQTAQEHVSERLASSAAKLSVSGGIVGGVPGGFDSPQIVRTAALRILTSRPGDTVEQLSALATRYAGTVQSSTVSGTERSQAAQLVLQVPAGRFDEARREIRKLASGVEKERTDARDVTHTLVDRDARLHNLRAGEAEYLAILKRADKVKDIVTSRRSSAKYVARSSESTPSSVT